MENPFKKILLDEKLPDFIKDRVADNIALLKLTLEVAELFGLEFPSGMTALIIENNKANG